MGENAEWTMAVGCESWLTGKNVKAPNKRWNPQAQDKVVQWGKRGGRPKKK
jgi:hypothetical protein